jgi:signal transduction histidine kinase
VSHSPPDGNAEEIVTRQPGASPYPSHDATTQAGRESELGAWVAALHEAESEAEVLRLALAAAATSPAVGADRAFLLRVRRSAKRKRELSGDLALGSRHPEEAAPLSGDAGAWAELASGDDFEALAPELTGLVRTLHLPIAEGGDPAAASCIDGRPRRATSRDGEMSPLWCERLGVRAYVAAPVAMAGRAEAVLVATRAGGDGLPAGGAEAMLAFLAAQAGLAVAGLRAVERGRLRRAQLDTVREVVRGLCEPQGLGAALARLTRVTAQASGAQGASLWLTDATGRGVRLERAVGPHDSDENAARAGELRPLAEACVFQRESPLLEDAALDSRLGPAARGLGSVTGAPLVALGRTRGALLIHGGAGDDTGEPAAFTREDQDLVALFAALGALLVEQAGLSARVGAAERRYEEAERLAVRAQSLAQLGEMSVRMAREMTSPLASIAGFARRVHGALAEGDPNREYLEIVVREGERLERLAAEHLQYAALQRFHLGLVSLNHIVQERLEQIGPELARKRVRLVKRLSPDLPTLLLDGDKISQAIHNVLQSALEGVAAGGCVKVETRLEGGVAVVETAHDGPPLGGDLLENLFVPFATGGRHGPGLGLALAQRIVRDHGGEIGVRREGDWGQILGLQLPIIGNEDRRAGRDRRRWGGERRNRVAQA